MSRPEGLLTFCLLIFGYEKNELPLQLKGMAAYSERCTSVKRNEMLRVVESPTGKKIQTLNVASSAVRNDVFLLNDNDELNNLFLKFDGHK